MCEGANDPKRLEALKNSTGKSILGKLGRTLIRRVPGFNILHPDSTAGKDAKIPDEPMYRNPKTGETIKIKARKVARFKAGKELAEML